MATLACSVEKLFHPRRNSLAARSSSPTAVLQDLPDTTFPVGSTCRTTSSMNHHRSSECLACHDVAITRPPTAVLTIRGLAKVPGPGIVLPATQATFGSTSPPRTSARIYSLEIKDASNCPIPLRVGKGDYGYTHLQARNRLVGGTLGMRAPRREHKQPFFAVGMRKRLDSSSLHILTHSGVEARSSSELNALLSTTSP
jgi:hypothetical protein